MLPRLSRKNLAFPPTWTARREPNGLLAAGGDLSAARLLAAYARGIFPWYAEGEPIFWWTPAPRAVLFPERLRITRSLRKVLRRNRYQVTVNQSFPEVLSACASRPRPQQTGTWITREMKRAYLRLHRLGFAHSMETRQDGVLVGGLYGVSLGRIFFGESMFYRKTDASKVALVHLCRELQPGYRLIDCQMMTPHLASLGATGISRASFEALLARHVASPHGGGLTRPDGLPAQPHRVMLSAPLLPLEEQESSAI